MAVAFDTVGPSSAGTSNLGSASLSWIHTTGANVALVVVVGVGSGADGTHTCTVTCDGNNMPSLGIIHSNNAATGYVQLFGLPNRGAGSHSIVASVTGGAVTSLEGGSVSYTGADLSSPFTTAQTAASAGVSATLTFTGSTSGNMVTAGVCAGSPLGSESAGTQRWINNASNGTGAGEAGQGDNAAGGSVTFTWPISPTDSWGIVAVEVIASTDGGPFSSTYTNAIKPHAPGKRPGPKTPKKLATGSSSITAETIVPVIGVTANVDVDAPDGTVFTDTPVIVTGVTALVSVNSVNGSTAVIVPGSTSQVTVNAVNGTAAVTVIGTTAQVSVAAPIAAPKVTVIGTTATETVAAPAGSVTVANTVVGVTATETIAAPAGTVTVANKVTGLTAQETVSAVAGTASVTVVGVTAQVNVAAPAGTVSTATSATVTGVTAQVTVGAPAGIPSVTVVAGPIANTAEGGTDTATVTTGNSGGASGDSWDVVQIAGTGGSLTYDSTHTAHGALAYKLVTGSPVGNSILEWTTKLGTVTTVPFRFSAYLSSLPGSTLRITQARSGSTVRGSIGINPAGLVVVLDASGSIILTSTTAITAGQWFRLEGFITGNASTGQIQVKIFTNPDGVIPDETLTTAATINTGGTIDRWEAGNPSSVASYTMWLDDLSLSPPNGTAQEVISAGAGTTSVRVIGTTAQETIAGVAGTASVTVIGTTAQVTVNAPAGTVSTAGSATVAGVTAQENVAAPNGITSVIVIGVTAQVAVAAPAGTVSTISTATVVGVTAQETVAAPNGIASVIVIGTTAQVSVSAPAGAVIPAKQVTGLTAQETVSAPAGIPRVTIIGVTAQVAITAIAGNVATPSGVTYGLAYVVSITTVHGDVAGSERESTSASDGDDTDTRVVGGIGPTSHEEKGVAPHGN